MSPEDREMEPWLAQARRTLDRQTGLSLQEAMRLQSARREAFAKAGAAAPPRPVSGRGKRPGWMPLGGLAAAASVMLAVVVVFNLETMQHPLLPVVLAELDDIEWVLELDEGFWMNDPAFLQWVMEETG
ncbi:hypothetical protein ECTPHS_00580 [Ectothiorhodospira sp. PHS-1]|uniref:hypothetical protein n=1 Tax=Ectothiorhodospira sp. PHS-1 TaxID=519989 RepID=UPI00024A85E3|nr:hypothetical protein [Ectothiorhodospira sp. PHS-1]EHQ51151.1 hypothetical protein ECTPHS_00580 [Ectothiorhodospira sp. PHS-1]